MLKLRANDGIYLAYTVKKGWQFSRPGRVWFVISRLGTERKIADLFYSVCYILSPVAVITLMELNVLGLYKKVKSRESIFKLLRSPGIDGKESIPSADVAWRAGTTTLFLLGS